MSWIRPLVLTGSVALVATLSPAPFEAADAKKLPCQPSGETTTLHLDCAALPNIPPVGVRLTESTSGSGLQTRISRGYAVDPFPQPTYDYFAWNSFAALNWPALVPEDHGGQRGFPDTGRTFTGAAATDLAVWETFKEKREVFDGDLQKPESEIPDPGPWNGPVRYLNEPADVPWCAGFPKGAGDGPKTLFAQVEKGFFDSLDETVEVSSEALESPDQLCGGHTATKCACGQSEALTCLSSNPSPCCLEASQSACCNVYGQAVAPRVWKKAKDRSSARPVYYEVKVNYDFYDYVRQNRYYLDSVKDADLEREGGPYIKLPYRSNDTLPPNGNRGVLNNSGRVLDYSAQACLQLSSEVNMFPELHGGVVGNFLPCRVGAVHVKAAWIELTPDEVASGKYHLREAAFYSTENDRLCARTGTFGLVGLHIIQRTHPTLPEGTPPIAQQVTFTDPVDGSQKTRILDAAVSAKAVGGAFVFATWEHREISPDDTRPSPDYVYANYFPGPIAGTKPVSGVQVPEAKAFYPAVSHGLPVERLLGEDGILASTRAVNQEVWKALGCSDETKSSHPVWCNYQLVGVQALPIDVTTPVGTTKNPVTGFQPNANDPTGIGQSLFLSNLVIETNHGLQRFQGLPPNTDKGGIADFKASGIRENPEPRFDRDLPNITFGQYQLLGQYGPGFTPLAYNMGGCLGCHGVAMLQGSSFSFVLQDGQKGATIDTEAVFEIAPSPVAARETEAPAPVDDGRGTLLTPRPRE